MAAAPAGEAAALLEGVVVSTTRRGKKLICQGFTYRFKHDMKGGIKGWQCDQADKNACKGTCKSRQEGDKVRVEVRGQHNHLPPPDVVTSLRIKSRMREQALSQPTATVSNLAASSLNSWAGRRYHLLLRMKSSSVPLGRAAEMISAKSCGLRRLALHNQNMLH